jgi:L-serine dehydratase
MTFTALAGDQLLNERTYYSVGGGFVVDTDASGQPRVVPDSTDVPYPFRTGAELTQSCAETGLKVSDIMLANECARRPEHEVRARLLQIWRVMRECIHRGCTTSGALPGRLRVRRRAADLYAQLNAGPSASPGRANGHFTHHDSDPLRALDWVTLWALAVNEENASGGRVVTAPTNGAAGIIPAVLNYAVTFVPGVDDDAIVRFLLVAGALAAIYQQTASISGAEVGCQGEVGTACSMAAGGLAEILGGSADQVENAAEIGMEHHLGLTCDPVGGLVQIPCIERNAVGSVQAITAARLALHGDGTHKVSLDKVIKTMVETGADMKVKYKETSRGGLAVNIIEC